jgi:hypothetical protein
MFSVTIDVWAPLQDSTSVGIANHLFDNTTQYLGQDLNSIGFWDPGNVYIDSVLDSSGFPSFGFDGAVVDVAVDRLNNLIWIRVNGGLWNNSTLANPATAIGGVDISYITGIVYPGASPYYYSGTEGKTSINTTAKYTVPVDFDFIGTEQGAWVPPGAETTFDDGITTDMSAWENDLAQPVQWINNSGQTVGWSNSYNGDPTTFDATSMRFEAPVDMYSNTDAYDKYLVFPKRNILG